MPKAPFADLLNYLRKVGSINQAKDLPDRELLESWLNDQEDAAFTALVHRHGPMVLRICQRVTDDAHLSEDAFQATFMVLARRARSIKNKAFVAGWLYAVAQRVARKALAKQRLTSQRSRERPTPDMRPEEPIDAMTLQELRSVLDEEIGRLPEKYQTPIVLCYLEGKSHDQAAKQLGWPKTTFTSRLTQARELLRRQLTGRGITMTAAALAAALPDNVAGATVRAMLAITTVRAAKLFAAGKSVSGGAISATVITLAEEAMRATIGVNAKLILMAATLCLVVGGAGFAGYRGLVENSQPTRRSESQVPPIKDDLAGATKKTLAIATDLYVDPLPEGAIARLGTVRFRHDAQVSKVAYSPDGKAIASAGGTAIGVCIWDAATGIPLHRLPGLVGSLAFSPDSKTIFTDHMCFIDVASGKELRRLKLSGGGQHVTAVAFSPDGQTVAAAERYTRAGDSNDLVVWDAATGKELSVLKGHTSPVRCLAYSPDSMSLASAGADKTVRIWEVATGKQLRRFEGDQNDIHCVAFAPDGKILAAAGKDRVIRLWDTATGKALQQFKVDEESTDTVAFSPDGKWLASGGMDGIVRLWDLTTTKELRRWQAHGYWVRSAAFSPSGDVLATVGSASAVRLWNTATGKEINPVPSHTGRIYALKFSAGGNTLFSTAGDCKVLEWDITTGRPLQTLFDGPLDVAPGADWMPTGNRLSPDGRLLALVRHLNPEGKLDHDIHLWDTVTGKEVRTLKGHRVEMEAIAFSPDGKLLASGADDGIRLWEADTGKELVRLQQQRLRSGMLVFSPNGQLLASAGWDNVIHLWEVATGKEIRSWDSQQKYLQRLTFSPDGKSIASANLEDPLDTIRIWSTATGKELLRFGRDSSWIQSMAFSPTGRILATAGQGGRKLENGDFESCSMVHLWEVFSGKEIHQFKSPQANAGNLAFAPDGKTLATGGGDSTILLWDLTGHAKIDQSKASPLSAKDVESLWTDLAGDATKADKAIWTLAFTPRPIVPYFKKHLQPLPPADAQLVAKLIADLDSKSFAERQQAAKNLDDLGEAAEGAVRKVLESKPALEVRQRLEQILKNRSANEVHKLRAIEALEQIGTAEARELLDAIAKGSPNPSISEAAKGALGRLTK